MRTYAQLGLEGVHKDRNNLGEEDVVTVEDLGEVGVAEPDTAEDADSIHCPNARTSYLREVLGVADPCASGRSPSSSDPRGSTSPQHCRFGRQLPLETSKGMVAAIVRREQHSLGSDLVQHGDRAAQVLVVDPLPRRLPGPVEHLKLNSTEASPAACHREVQAACYSIDWLRGDRPHHLENDLHGRMAAATDHHQSFSSDIDDQGLFPGVAKEEQAPGQGAGGSDPGSENPRPFNDDASEAGGLCCIGKEARDALRKPELRGNRHPPHLASRETSHVIRVKMGDGNCIQAAKLQPKLLDVVRQGGTP